MRILAIESSCDETAAAVVEDGRRVLSGVVASQIEVHRLYGGVVPEIASRAHTEHITAVTQEALLNGGFELRDMDAVAVTYAPGLIGALLVGLSFAKGLCLGAGLPLVPVHHLRAHVASNYIAHAHLEPPFLCLVASGGHSHIVMVRGYTDFEVVGTTRDDAAGEAYDKAARVLGLSYPGGAAIDALSKEGKATIRFPRVSFSDAPYDFSFSGVKTAVINHVHRITQRGEAVDRADVAASFNEAVTDVLCEKLMAAAGDLKVNSVAAAGGVAANSLLREKLTKMAAMKDLRLFLPPRSLCGDNAAMVGAQGYFEFLAGGGRSMSQNAFAVYPIDRAAP